MKEKTYSEFDNYYDDDCRKYVNYYDDDWSPSSKVLPKKTPKTKVTPKAKSTSSITDRRLLLA